MWGTHIGCGRRKWRVPVSVSELSFHDWCPDGLTVLLECSRREAQFRSKQENQRVFHWLQSVFPCFVEKTNSSIGMATLSALGRNASRSLIALPGKTYPQSKEWAAPGQHYSSSLTIFLLRPPRHTYPWTHSPMNLLLKTLTFFYGGDLARYKT